MKQIYSKILLLMTMLLVGGSVSAQTFKKVTSAPADWSGEYVMAIEQDGKAMCWDGTDAADNTVNADIVDGAITLTDPITIIVEAMAEGYSVKVSGGVNDGKYISSGTSAPTYSNGLKFITKATRVDFDLKDGFVEMSQTIAGSGIMRMMFNKTSGNMRFRFYKENNYGTANYPMPVLYKKSSAPVIPVDVTGVALDKTTAEIMEGKTATLTATVQPANASNKKVTWSSSNTSVATVLNGVVTGVTPGKANITVTTEDGKYTATCAVTVKEFAIPDEFTFLFTPNGTDGDSGAAYGTDPTKAFTEGAEFAKSVEAYKVYPARNSLVNGAKFGSSSEAGTITINLEKPVYVEKVIVSAALYGDSEGQDGFTVNGKAVSMASGKNKVYADYEIDMDNDEISSITITQSKASKGRIYVKSIKVVQAKIEITPEYLAARESLLEEIGKAKEVLDRAAGFIGVNVFMYGQGAYKKFCKKIEEIEGKVNKYPNELAIYDAIDQVRNAQREFRPIFRGVNADYAIKHIESGLYLNISEDGVTLAEEPTPINFHNLLYEPELHIEQYKECGFQILHSGYLYNTPERKYLGAEWEEVQYEEGEDTWTEYELVLQPNKLRQWYIMVTGDNTYGIFIREDYETPNGKFSKFVPLLGMPEYDEETEEIISYFPCVSYMQELNNPDEWFIEDYVAPTFDVPTEKEGEYAEEATSIAGASTAVTPVAYFTANGAQLKSAQKGLNIVKMSDNSVRKIFVK